MEENDDLVPVTVSQNEAGVKVIKVSVLLNTHVSYHSGGCHLSLDLL